MIRLQSRLTPLNLEKPTPVEPLLKDTRNREVWVLRDDELGGFWGTKFRKYASITEYCLTNSITHILATGGVNSNNLAAAATLCTERGLKVIAYAIDDHDDRLGNMTGNRMLLRLALPPERLIIVPREEKKTVPEMMRQTAARLAAEGFKSLILDEGGGCEAAVPGCLTLASDVIRTRDEWPDGRLPDHIFMDSGTGLSVASLAAGLHLSGNLSGIKIHVIQMAGFEEQIIHALDRWITPVTGVKWQDLSQNVRVYRPLSPRSYGATNETLFAFIRNVARCHGLLLDPIYSGKLFIRALDLIDGQNCRGRIVVIHTGGISGLMGFPKIATDASAAQEPEITDR